MTAHAKLGPSAADRWMTCTASVALIERLIAAGELSESDYEDEQAEELDEGEIIESGIDAYADVVFNPDQGSIFSAEGTVLHEIRQMCLDLGLDPMAFAGKTFTEDKFSFVIDEDMLDRLVEGIDWIREHTQTPDVEIRVDLSSWLPRQFGTCDTGWYAARNKTLYISDYKNGIGKPVAAEGNKQLRLYALGYWDQIGRPLTETVLLNIDQPRAGGMKFWEFPFEELLEFGEEVKKVFARIDSGDVEFVPTASGCQWCPVKKTKRGCAAYNLWMLRFIGAGIEDVNSPPRFKDPAQMPRAVRYHIVRNSSAIRAWLAELYDNSLAAAIDGDPDPGSKAIEGSAGRRHFPDEEAAKRILVRALGRKAFKPRSIIGITDIEKLIKPGRKKEGVPQAWADLQPLIAQKGGAPKLVPSDHPNPAFESVTADDFDDLD